MAVTVNPVVDALSGLGLSADTGPAPRPLPSAFIAQWPAQTVLRLRGADSRKFLQGQLTCQIEQLATEQSLLGAACTPKGTAITNMRLVQLENDDILLRLPADLTQTVLAHFRKYLAFFKATLEPAPDWCLLGLTGDAAHQALGVSGSNNAGQVLQWNQSLVTATQPGAAARQRSELWLHQSDFARLESCLTSSTGAELPAPQAAWLATEIQAGLTCIDAQLQERLVPQYFNWHAIDGINFKKGCYTGQEIIARMHYLGQLKKSTYRVQLPEGGGEVLAAVTSATGKTAGEITNLVTYTDGQQEALAVINHRSSREPLQLAGKPECPVILAELPYPVAEQEAAAEQP